MGEKQPLTARKILQRETHRVQDLFWYSKAQIRDKFRSAVYADVPGKLNLIRDPKGYNEDQIRDFFNSMVDVPGEKAEEAKFSESAPEIISKLKETFPELCGENGNGNPILLRNNKTGEVQLFGALLPVASGIDGMLFVTHSNILFLQNHPKSAQMGCEVFFGPIKTPITEIVDSDIYNNRKVEVYHNAILDDIKDYLINKVGCVQTLSSYRSDSIEKVQLAAIIESAQPEFQKVFSPTGE